MDIERIRVEIKHVRGFETLHLPPDFVKLVEQLLWYAFEADFEHHIAFVLRIPLFHNIKTYIIPLLRVNLRYRSIYFELRSVRGEDEEDGEEPGLRRRKFFKLVRLFVLKCLVDLKLCKPPCVRRLEPPQAHNTQTFAVPLDLPK